MAKESGFQKRCSGKINGRIFLDLIVFNRLNLKQQSLNGLSLNLFQNHTIDITKQSLHERFNACAVLFLKTALEQLLVKQLESELHLNHIKGFSRILIKDSTCFQLTDNLMEEFAGCGGTGSKASARIQFEFDILSGKISALSLTPSTHQDATDSAATIEMINPGELILRDLGYMNAAVCANIIKICAYFICRLHPSYDVYEIIDQKRNKLDFNELRNFMLQNNLSSIEKNVLIGAEKLLPVRLIITLLPDEIVSQRIRRLTRKQNQKGRKQLSKEYTARCFFNLFITNVPVSILTKEAISALYKFRWLVELVFKTWKSTWGIHEVKKVNVHRFKCYVYAKLLVIIASWKFLWNLMHSAYKIGGLLISMDKCNKALQANVTIVKELLFGSCVTILKNIETICKKINQLQTEKHGSKTTQIELIVQWGK